MHSLLKTTTDSSYTHATTSSFHGGELLSYGRSENLAVGPLSSLELKLDQVIDLLVCVLSTTTLIFPEPNQGRRESEWEHDGHDATLKLVR